MLIGCKVCVCVCVCPPPTATCMKACRVSVLSGEAFLGHVLLMLITEMLGSIPAGGTRSPASSGAHGESI